jgi:hypothetical protein
MSQKIFFLWLFVCNCPVFQVKKKYHIDTVALNFPKKDMEVETYMKERAPNPGYYWKDAKILYDSLILMLMVLRSLCCGPGSLLVRRMLNSFRSDPEPKLTGYLEVI